MTSSNEMLPKYDFICGNLFTQNVNHISPKRQSQWLSHLLWTKSKAARRYLCMESCNFCNFVFSQFRCQAVRSGEGNQSRPLLLGLFLISSSSLAHVLCLCWSHIFSATALEFVVWKVEKYYKNSLVLWRKYH